MRLTRVHVEVPLVAGQSLDLPEGPAGHLARVLRLGVGDACIVFNGDGHDYHARLAEVGKRHVRVEIGGCVAVDKESPLRVVLLQSVARGEKMDLVLQKATELGVDAVQPAWSQRSEVRLEGARADKRLAHWRSVVVSACEQSGRAWVPAVEAPLPLPAALAALPATPLRLTLDPDAALSLGQLQFEPAQPVVVAIGPEGGWSPQDLEQLREAGFTGMRLGPRVLRTETAGLAVLSALQARFGDLA
ncbi:16S rRNA (uracil(1498)-N(3))-methyltransferase [Marilutibacter aestuarii]|uniref:Ribosomal RNA small subunit methyltransferase E n=1 Tax=Marilutibacter aestuarii TaxID=1706195 RepID=A0A508AB30_9GAMM|nr:16S rRNA (uracil(1498)-N(3))-methyltransferase [Lysobacter aestuarii]TQD46113.1 16S rRNA (uracil(1498)-N(3))-methyltransferase [Lysobacter aestuarii]